MKLWKNISHRERWVSCNEDKSLPTATNPKWQWIPFWGSLDKLKQMHFRHALFILCILNKDASVSTRFVPSAVYQITLFPINNSLLWHYKMGQRAAFSLLPLLSYTVWSSSIGKKKNATSSSIWWIIAHQDECLFLEKSIRPGGSRCLHCDAVTLNVKQQSICFPRSMVDFFCSQELYRNR